MLLLGEFHHTVDQASRLTVPARFREDMGGEAVLFRALEGCLFLYGKDEFEKVIASAGKGTASASGRKKLRSFYADAAVVTVDRTGRFIIPPDFMSHASLQTDVVMLGVGNHFEIWDAERYEADMGDRDSIGAEDYPEIEF